jgi:alkylhydroperoxidase family enzyme
MARVPYPEHLSEEAQALVARNGNLNVNRMMAHAFPVVDGFARLGWALLRKGKLDPALRELAVLRIGVNCGSAYEWRQHVGFARAVGTREVAIQAARSGAFAELNELERLVVDFADQIYARQEVDEATLARARQHLDEERLVELTMACGYYVMTAGFLKTFGIEIEDGAPLGEQVAGDVGVGKGRSDA